MRALKLRREEDLTRLEALRAELDRGLAALDAGDYVTVKDGEPHRTISTRSSRSASNGGGPRTAAATKPSSRRTIEICARTLEEAEIQKNQIEDVVLVGGMTRMSRVQQACAEFFGLEPCKGVHPDEVVALGPAIQGAALTDDKRRRPAMSRA